MLQLLSAAMNEEQALECGAASITATAYGIVQRHLHADAWFTRMNRLSVQGKASKGIHSAHVSGSGQKRASHDVMCAIRAAFSMT